MPQPTPEDFDQLVAEALDSLPDDIAAAMDNVEVVVEDEPSADIRAGAGRGVEILGHYHGIPLTNRSYYNNALPDRISIYRGPITRTARTPGRIKEQVRRTVIHEIAHHFGINDARLRELGWG
jgi:predicted Zn-dependent protease with MMP-like domain